MTRTWKGAFALGISVAAAAAAWVGLAPQSTAQSGAGWTILVDDKTMGEWDKVGETNWRMEDGALVADKRTSQEIAYLLSKQKHKDFQIYAEFWSSDDANSGVFLR